jgi:hypothetical protein
MESKDDTCRVENEMELSKIESLVAQRVQTVDVENYHGLTARTVLVYLVRQLVFVFEKPC